MQQIRYADNFSLSALLSIKGQTVCCTWLVVGHVLEVQSGLVIKITLSNW